MELIKELPKINIKANDPNTTENNFIISITDVLLEDNVEHISTDWQVLDSKDNIVFKSIGDDKNKRYISVSKDLLNVNEEYEIRVALNLKAPDSTIQKVNLVPYPFVADPNFSTNNKNILIVDNPYTEVVYENATAIEALSDLLRDEVAITIYFKEYYKTKEESSA
jgi:hypothetical protein